MPRFVILRHDTPAGSVRPLHWDLMLESGPALRTWALEQPPGSEQSVTGTQLPDHRLDYLQYEGPVSSGRGDVSRWDGGEYTWIEDGRDQLIVRLAGNRLQCTVTLIRDQDRPERWQFCFGP